MDDITSILDGILSGSGDRGLLIDELRCRGMSEAAISRKLEQRDTRLLDEPVDVRFTEILSHPARHGFVKNS